jgi:hypothetical protein
MKVFEYFYMGKSVVSAPIEELRRYPGHVTVVDGAAEWRAAIESELGGDVRLDMRKRRRKLALTQTWEKKLTYMGDLLG